MSKFGIFLLLLFAVSCENNEPHLYIVQGNAFGTTYGIQYYASDLFEAEKGIDSVIHAVNRSVSTYMFNSDISRINRGDTTVVVDAIFKEVFRVSETVYTNSQRYFDPTIGVLRNAYGFGDVAPLHNIDSQRLDSLMDYVGFSKVAIRSNGTVQKERPEIYFDFNAVAKGYGIDCIGRYLESQQITDYIIELGGEIVAKGSNSAKNKPWIVGIELVASNLENRDFVASIKLQDMAMASSGNYRKFRIDSVTGNKYVHTINPLTGSAEQSDVTSATVVASSCVVADAYATAIMAMGLERSKVMLKLTPEIEAYLTYNDALNNEQIYMTEGFKKLLIN